jgi:hypothetical protein
MTAITIVRLMAIDRLEEKYNMCNRLLFYRQRNCDFIVDKIKVDHSHQELLYLKKNKLEYLVYSISQIRLRHIILELRHRDKT